MGLDVSLALSGSSSKIFAHLGFLQSVEAMGLNVTEVNASSGGALIAALWASGLSLDMIQHRLEEEKIREYGALGWRDYLRGALYGFMAKRGSKKLRGVLEKYFGTMQMRDLPIHLRVMVSNMTDGRLAVISPRSHPEMLVADAVYMSASVPALFQPHIREGDETMYRDGGIYKDFPVDIDYNPALPRLGHLITSRWRPEASRKFWTFFHEMALVLTRLVDANVDHSLSEVEDHENVVIGHTDVSGIHMLDFNLSDEVKEDLRFMGEEAGRSSAYELLNRLDPDAFKAVKRL